MKRRLKEPFGKAGLTVAVIALVFAMLGGAYAASGLNGKQKKEVKKIAKKFAGKPGQNGATGPAGPAGPKGDTGAKGDNGTNGTNGTNGADGTDGTDGTNGTFSTEPLPPGETLTGVFSQYKTIISVEVNDQVFEEPIEQNAWASFPIRVVPAPTLLVYANGAENKGLKFDPATGNPSPPPLPAAFVEGAEFDALCPGDEGSPEAAPGVVCVYEDAFGTEAAAASLNNAAKLKSPDPSSGVIFPLAGPGDSTIAGSWAVTAEE